MHEDDDDSPGFIAAGVIADNGSNRGVAGQTTYLVSTSDWFVWDGEHQGHAARFATHAQAMAAARSCLGPLFRMPGSDSIHAFAAKASRCPT